MTLKEHMQDYLYSNNWVGRFIAEYYRQKGTSKSFENYFNENYGRDLIDWAFTWDCSIEGHSVWSARNLNYREEVRQSREIYEQ